MKYLRMFEAASGLFPKRINVTLIDAANGNYLGKYKIPAELLPAAFNRPITLEIDNINWRVLQADPVLADDFLFSKKLSLQVQQAATVGEGQLKYSLPTVCSDLPATGATSLYHDFTLEITDSDWRQVEFVPLSQSEIIEEAVKTIEAILNGQLNPLLGYELQYIRNNGLQLALAISLDEFCSHIINPMKGNIFYNNAGFVQNGFAVRSNSYAYYGILENGLIRTLCLQQFDWADDEFMCVLSTYELSLIDWCNASRISAEAGETPKSEFINI
ncbi:hypothetical protein HB364_32560 [Pseudoflavitalea sp. X16]|uniref:hypothetical protein n=1 Tax=Paraflavitalea devenefica TaxID=2716334 RepID=UPI00141ED4C3|nr:hypothetical protein [Paraflavitalea devenefica]NII29856.1 hypothetical protein [Paraflavitalea devenefica]